MSTGRHRWNAIRRDWTDEDILKLRGNVSVEYSIAKQGSCGILLTSLTRL